MRAVRTWAARSHAFQGFVLFERENVCFPGIADSLHYHATDKMLFRFVKE